MRLWNINLLPFSIYRCRISVLFGGLLFFMQKKEIKSLLNWLVDLRELNKTEDEINELANVYIKKFQKHELSFLPDDSWRKLVNYWLEYKLEKRQSYKTDKSVKIFCKHLVELSQGNIDIAAAIIQNSVANNYSGIFQLKNNAKLTANINQQSNHDSTNEAIRILYEQG